MQINQLFQLLNLIWANGCALHGLTRMLMSQNANNDVSKDSPEVEATKTFCFFCLLQSNITYSQLGNQLKVVSLWSNDTWQSKLLRSAWVRPTVIPLLCRKTHITSSPSSSFCWNRKKPTLTSLHITFGKKGWHSGKTDNAASRMSWRVTITQDVQSIDARTPRDFEIPTNLTVVLIFPFRKLCSLTLSVTKFFSLIVLLRAGT